MKRVIVLLSFIHLKLALKILFYKHVITEMTGNPLFPDPDVPLADLTEIMTKVETHYARSRSGNNEELLMMQQSMEEADDKFRKMAKYVDRIADGDEATIENAGFKASRQPRPRRRPVFAAYNGETPGQIILRCKAVKGAKAYSWQFAATEIPEKEGDWIYAGSSTQVTFTIDNLDTLSKYWFRYCAIKTEGMTPWCDPIMKIVL